MNGQTYRLSVEIDSSGAENKVSTLKSKITELTGTSKQLDDAFKKSSQSANLYQQAISKVDGVSGKIKQTLDRLKTTAKGAGDGVEQAGKDIKRAGNDAKDAQSKFDGLGQAFGRLKGLMLAGMAFAGVGSVVQTADAMKTLDSQIKIATGSAEKHAVAMSEIERIAMANNVSLSSVGEMYVSNERALKQLGKSQSEVLKFTENVTQAMRLGGGSAEGQAAALTQLGQALASGVLRGDEFNSIAEQAPAIMDLLSQSLGVTTGELRKMAGDGKLTADVLYKAMTDAKATDKLQSMASQTSTTVQGALENVRTQWDLAVHAIMNSKGGVSDIIANGILLVANGLQKVGDYLPTINQYISDVISKGKELWDSFSNSEFGQASFDVLKSAFDGLKDAIQGVIDIADGITTFLRENPEFAIALASGLTAAATAYFVITGAMSLFATVSGAVATAGGLAAMATTALGTAVAFLTSPVTIAVAAIAALVAIGVALYRNWDTVKAKAIEVWNAIPEYANQAWQWISGVWSGIGAWFGGIWDSVKSAVSTAIDGVKQAFFEWLGGMPAPVQEMVANIGSIFNALASVAATVWGGIVSVVQVVVDGIVALWQDLTAAVSGIWSGIVSTATTVWHGIVSVVSGVIDAIKPIITSVLSFLSSAWQGLVGVAKSTWDGIKSVVSVAINAIKAVFTAGITIFASVFNAGFNTVKNIFTTTFNVIKALVRGDMNGVKTAIAIGLQNAVSIAKSLLSNILSAFTSLGSQLLGAGRDAVQGFINGITGKMGEALAKARELANKVVSTVKSALDIHSPSRVMKALGGYAGEGFVLGLGEKVKDAKQAAQDLANAVTSTIGELHKQKFLLQNTANPLAELDYKLQFGELAELTDKQKARIKELAQANLELAKSNETLTGFGNQMADLSRQIALLGVDSPIKQLEYDLANSEKYAGYTTEQLDRLKSKMMELENAKALQGFNSELEKATTEMQKQEFILKNIGDKYAAMKFDLTQKGYNSEQIGQMVSVQERTDTITAFGNLQQNLQKGTAFTMPTINSGQGLQGAGNALAGGISGMANLDKQYQEQLAIIKNARQAQLDINADYDQQELDLKAAHEAAKRELTLNSAQGIASGLASATKSMFGEQSKAYRAMFAMEQGVAIARSVMAIQQAIAFASANPFPMNLGAMATVAAQTMGIVAKIKAIKNPVVGQAHDGIMSVPKSGTWNLEKGERVLPKHTAKALDDKLNSMGSGGQTIIVNVAVNSDGTANVDSQAQIGKQMGEAIKVAVQQEMIKQTRQGGLFYGR